MNTVENELKRVKDNIGKGINVVRVGLVMNDTPLSVVKAFKHDIHLYNDMYWVKLQDLMRKAEAYDYIMSMGQSMSCLEEPVQQQEKEDENTIKTFGGLGK